MRASAQGDAVLVRHLCDWRAGLEARDAQGRTALHLAAAGHCAATVLALAAHGADVAARVAEAPQSGAPPRGGVGADAIGLACDGAVARALIAAGAPAGGSQLVAAAGDGRLGAVRALLEAGVAADAESPRRGRFTALMAAAARGHVSVVTALLLAGADAGAQTANGTTALTVAGLYNASARSAVLCSLREHAAARPRCA